MEKYPKEDFVTPKAEIRETKNKGKGLFAKEKINKGEVVIVWGGNYVTKDEAEVAKQQGKLVMQFDDNLFSVEDRGESSAYFVNHSCNPNLWMKDSFTLEALKDININEELTADYVMWETREDYVSKWVCFCGSINCRGRITGKDYLLLDLQQRYKNHFLPFINKKINLWKAIKM